MSIPEPVADFEIRLKLHISGHPPREHTWTRFADEADAREEFAKWREQIAYQWPSQVELWKNGERVSQYTGGKKYGS